ncbi:hypothetical protein Poli38472_008855 [Pythium oligandrum]|uniref:Carboxypeptidase D n=1 Tax=Pythium oligandrum TaxID=41045 RepID=A0A8K1FE30_PYTOL|nr:hypothetical protein Poli38472_008855 [Pythium oligandrum]|eukprot:TMW56207.1 hypothetical protein Poli38472_008855 [Pythium oligandrum]
MRATRVLLLCVCSALVGVSTSMRRIPADVARGVNGEVEELLTSLRGNRELSDDSDDISAADDDLVTTAMPGLQEELDVTHHAGRIALDKAKKNNIFYWHFAAASSPETAPLVVWLNGGPGCTSMQGALMGISPFKLVDASTIGVNENSWHNTANLLFLDQPVGTGMSYTRGNDYRSDEKAIANDFYQILIQFFQRHNGYLTKKGKGQISRDLYIFGESHAGRYIPQFSDYILQQNKRTDKEVNIEIRLKGVGIGNGWVHPYIQYDYSDYAHGLGLLTFGQVRSLKSSFTDCQNALLAEKFNTPSCFANMDGILDSVKNSFAGSKSLNYYDVRQFVQSVASYPASRQHLSAYMDQVAVRQALHGNTDPSFHFRDCSDNVYSGLREFDGVSTLGNVENLLQSGIRVLFYNGQWDMMCNHYSTEKLLLHLNWNGSAVYQDAKKYTWSVATRRDPAGFAQQGGNLTYLVIASAGHMVPMDVPDVAAEMMKRFVQDLPFDDSPQTVTTVKTNSTDLETTECFPANTSESSQYEALTWLWISLVIAGICGLLVTCVVILCARGKKKRRSDHAVIVQMSDDEDDDQEQAQRQEQEQTEDEAQSDDELNVRSRG